jgi:DNA-binding transcriptional regulator of glucitol operon
MQQLFIMSILALISIVVNRTLSVSQQLKLNKELVKIKQRGPLSSVGLCKGITGNKVAVLIAEKNGDITEAYCIKGMTVTSKFHKVEDFPYKNYEDLLLSLGKKGKLSNQEKAWIMAAQYLKEGIESHAKSSSSQTKITN